MRLIVRCLGVFVYEFYGTFLVYLCIRCLLSRFGVFVCLVV